MHTSQRLQILFPEDRSLQAANLTMRFTKNQMIAAATAKIRHQYIGVQDNPDVKLQFAVVAQAIRDLGNRDECALASRYLREETIPHAASCGVDSEWIRSVLHKTGVLDGEAKDRA